MTKLGYNIIGDPTRPKLMKLIEETNPAVVVVHDYDSPEALKLITDRVPHVVYRWDDGRDWWHWSIQSYIAETERRLTEKHLGQMGLIWKIPNEPVIHTVEDAKWLNEFQVIFSETMTRWGEQTLAYSFPTGNPVDTMLWPYLWPGLQVSTFHGAHRYWGPATRWSQVDHDKVEYDLLPELYRRPVIWDEMGCDADGQPQTGGYRNAENGLTPQTYVEEVLSGYLDRMNARPEMVGGAIYVWGGNWPSFQIEPLTDRLVSLSRAKL